MTMAIYAKMDRGENSSLFIPKFLVVEEKEVHSASCPGLGTATRDGKQAAMQPPQPCGVMLRSEPGPHQLSKELWSRKKTQPQPELFICGWSEAKSRSKTLR